MRPTGTDRNQSEKGPYLLRSLLRIQPLTAPDGVDDPRCTVTIWLQFPDSDDAERIGGRFFQALPCLWIVPDGLIP
jgi:hypothetical protein